MSGPIVLPSQLADAPKEVPCHIADGIITKQGITVVVAEANAGKSTFGQHMAFCMAMGWPCFGRPAHANGVLYVVGEGFSGIPGRIGALCAHHGVDAETLDSRLGFLALPLDLSAQEMVDRVFQHAEELGLTIDVVMIDTLSSNAPLGFNENDNAHMKGYMDLVRALRDQRKCAVVLFHHTGNANGAAGARARGAYDLTASADTILFISREGDLRTVKMTKARDFALIEPFQFKLQPCEGSVVVVPADGARGMSLGSGEVLPSVRNALATLVECGMGVPMPNARWFHVSGLQRTAFYSAKKALLSGGYVVQDGKGFVPTNKADQLLKLSENSSRTISRTPGSSSSAPPYKGGGANELPETVRGVRNELRADNRHEGPGLQEFPWFALEGAE